MGNTRLTFTDKDGDGYIIPAGNKAGLDSRNSKQYEYTNSKGEKVTIRQDKPAKYNNGGDGGQGKHYNAGPSGNKLKQHHNYQK